MKIVFILTFLIFNFINCNNNINQSNSISETTFNVKINNLPISKEYDCNDSVDFKIDFTIADSIYVYPFYIKVRASLKSAENTYIQFCDFNLYTNRGSILIVMPVNEIKSESYENPALIRFELHDRNRGVELKEINLNVNYNISNCNGINK